MALKKVSIGTAKDIYVFDDGDTEYGLETDGKVKVSTAPTVNDEVVRLQDIAAPGDAVTAVANIANHSIVRGDGGGKGVQDSGIIIDDSNNVLLPGDLVFTLSGNGLSYGSLYAHEAALNVDITTPGIGVYVKITGLTTGLLNNVSVVSDAFRAPNIGIYKVDWQVSADSQGNNLTYECDIFVNGVEQPDGSARRKFGAAADYGSFSGTAILDITNATHDIDLRIKQVGGVAADLDIFNLNFNIVQIGGT